MAPKPPTPAAPVPPTPLIPPTPPVAFKPSSRFASSPSVPFAGWLGATSVTVFTGDDGGSSAFGSNG